MDFLETQKIVQSSISAGQTSLIPSIVQVACSLMKLLKTATGQPMSAVNADNCVFSAINSSVVCKTIIVVY